jgi:hypothetical protein
MVRCVCLFFGSTTLDSFLLTAAGCLSGAMPVMRMALISTDSYTTKDRQSDTIFNLMIDEYENSKQHL